MANIHIVPKDGQWQSKQESKRASKTFDTQKEAISYGRKQAEKNHSELVIHGKDGKIREKNSYGKDDFPPIG